MSFATELLTNPSLLFVDEPTRYVIISRSIECTSPYPRLLIGIVVSFSNVSTVCYYSGLDSFVAETVVLQLQKLARAGRTVVATIHQPSSELYHLFDHLLLISDGHCVYHDKTVDAVQYFSNQGLPCPQCKKMTAIITLSKDEWKYWFSYDVCDV